MLTKEKILRAPKKNYMDKDQLSFFKTQLNELKKETLKHIKDAKERLSNPPVSYTHLTLPTMMSV